MFNGAFHSAVIGIALVGVDGELKRVNPSFARLLGYPADELLGLRFQTVTHPDDLSADVDLFEAVKRGEIDHYRLEKRYIRKSGDTAHGMLSVSVVRDEAGAPELFIAQVEDISVQKSAERSARDEAARLALALEVLDGGPWEYDILGSRFAMSPYFIRFVCGEGQQGLSFDEFGERVHPDDRSTLDMDGLITGRTERAVVHVRVRIHSGEYRWMRVSCKLLRDATGRPETIVGISIDISDERNRQARLQAEAESDPLTALLNRRGFERRAGRAGATWHGAAVIDLDHFKAINDRHGHAAGDAVLREAARRIAEMARPGDVVARFGGDEFVILLAAEGLGDCHAFADRMLALLEKPYVLAEGAFSISASIGVAPRNHDEEAIEGLLVRADAALYEAKRAGRAVWRLAA